MGFRGPANIGIGIGIGKEVICTNYLGLHRSGCYLSGCTVFLMTPTEKFDGQSIGFAHLARGGRG